MPHTTQADYANALVKAVDMADYKALRAEQKERRERGDTKLLGIGVCCCVEVTAGHGSEDYASVEVGEDGKVVLKAGTSSHGGASAGGRRVGHRGGRWRFG